MCFLSAIGLTQAQSNWDVEPFPALQPTDLKVTASSSLTSDNQLMQTQKWKAVWGCGVWLHSYSDAWLIRGFWTEYNNGCEGGWRSDFTHYSDKPVQGGGGGGVVGGVMTRWRLVVFPVLVAFGVKCRTLRVQSSNRLWKTRGNKSFSCCNKVVYLLQ